MGRHSRPEDLKGGLQGTWLKALGVVSITAVVVAVWQLAASSHSEDRTVSGDGEGPSIVISPAPETTTADPSPSASEDPSTEPSPSFSPPPRSEPTVIAESSEPQPEETTEAAAVEDGPSCSAALRIDHQWRGGVQVAVIVSSTGGEAIDGWEIDLDLRRVDIERFWNMSHHRGDDYRNEGWNGHLAPGEATEAGFQAEVGRRYDLPESVPCRVLS